jgi:hypothetical protein
MQDCTGLETPRSLALGVSLPAAGLALGLLAVDRTDGGDLEPLPGGVVEADHLADRIGMKVDRFPLDLGEEPIDADIPRRAKGDHLPDAFFRIGKMCEMAGEDVDELGTFIIERQFRPEPVIDEAVQLAKANVVLRSAAFPVTITPCDFAMEGALCCRLVGIFWGAGLRLGLRGVTKHGPMLSVCEVWCFKIDIVSAKPFLRRVAPLPVVGPGAASNLNQILKAGKSPSAAGTTCKLVVTSLTLEMLRRRCDNRARRTRHLKANNYFRPVVTQLGARSRVGDIARAVCAMARRARFPRAARIYYL